MSNDNTYKVFVRDWWKENASWPNGLEPCAGEIDILHTGIESEYEARELCKEYNATHDPGRLSRRAEFDTE